MKNYKNINNVLIKILINIKYLHGTDNEIVATVLYLICDATVLGGGGSPT